jgi:hypothetical protein
LGLTAADIKVESLAAADIEGESMHPKLEEAVLYRVPEQILIVQNKIIIF